MTVRQPAVAGTFYPDDPAILQKIVSNMLQETEQRDLSPKALIVPHAGYIYSGPVAASAYQLLEPFHDNINRVVLLGPSHQVAFEGLALPDADHFMTPLGSIHLDRPAMAALSRFSQVQTLSQAHAREHSLEVQLPFLQTCLESFSLVPLVVGNASALVVAEVIDFLWGKEDTLIVISSDLSHYHSYEEAQRRDNLTVKAIEQLTTDLTGGQACGCCPINGMLKVAQRRGMEVQTLDVRNSGDTAGDKQRVVGYGAFAIQ
ncbi:AmmeMemoRadiSam system protein B [Endozoicomonas euniceicola]|uniref:MEMO1 family protein NX720_05470 n=1 Tax=Endozoicomonas euniceicola TaxID=1234143 RepID=A0ABY6GZE8_9GAMM|nr:AmmeMemoRadiSam system protein B [Endozoicomonas euniceicola]UYM17368.1 AmmeMemoRadiSam system protein B [Endozoicomonas euniceicola]